jgi:hypothetical protein
MAIGVNRRYLATSLADEVKGRWMLTLCALQKLAAALDRILLVYNLINSRK